MSTNPPSQDDIFGRLVDWTALSQTSWLTCYWISLLGYGASAYLTFQQHSHMHSRLSEGMVWLLASTLVSALLLTWAHVTTRGGLRKACRQSYLVALALWHIWLSLLLVYGSGVIRFLTFESPSHAHSVMCITPLLVAALGRLMGEHGKLS